jgi:ankyrin repeat protein
LALECAEARELVKILLSAGANPTAIDVQRGQTALHAAAIANDVEMVKVRTVLPVECRSRFCTVKKHLKDRD